MLGKVRHPESNTLMNISLPRRRKTDREIGVRDDGKYLQGLGSKHYYTKPAIICHERIFRCYLYVDAVIMKQSMII